MQSYPQTILNPHEMLYKLQTPHEVINNSSANEVGNDIVRNGQLIRALEEDQSFAEDELLKCKKDKIVEDLRLIIQDWISQIYASSDRVGEDVFLGDLQVFGSFRTGVNARDGDIDTIVIAPSWVILTNTPEEQPKCVRFMGLVECSGSSSKVQVLRFEIIHDPIDVQIDMVFASIRCVLQPLSSSPPIDDKSQRSLNGLRAADYFASIYKDNRKFKYFLRSVKLWATQRGIYGGVSGYLGGISWSILVSKIMQLYPYYSLSQLLERFFFIYSQWPWGDLPVILENEIQEDNWKGVFMKGFLNRFIQDHPSQQADMTIQTPIFPSINSTHNVSSSTLKIVQDQFVKAVGILQNIKFYGGTWNQLFKNMPFFDLYPQYLELRALSNNINDLCAWKGHLQSRLRKLTKLFEDPKYSLYFSVHLFPKSFTIKDESQTEYRYGESFFYGIKPYSHTMNIDLGGKYDITQLVRYFLEQLEGTQPYVIVPETLCMFVQIVLKNQVSQDTINQL